MSVPKPPSADGFPLMKALRDPSSALRFSAVFIVLGCIARDHPARRRGRAGDQRQACDQGE